MRYGFVYYSFFYIYVYKYQLFDGNVPLSMVQQQPQTLVALAQHVAADCLTQLALPVAMKNVC